MDFKKNFKLLQLKLTNPLIFFKVFFAVFTALSRSNKTWKNIILLQESETVDSDIKTETVNSEIEAETVNSEIEAEEPIVVNDPNSKPEVVDEPETEPIGGPEPVLIEDVIAFKSAHALWPLGKPYRDVKTLVRNFKKSDSA